MAAEKLALELKRHIKKAEDDAEVKGGQAARSGRNPACNLLLRPRFGRGISSASTAFFYFAAPKGQISFGWFV